MSPSHGESLRGRAGRPRVEAPSEGIVVEALLGVVGRERLEQRSCVGFAWMARAAASATLASMWPGGTNAAAASEATWVARCPPPWGWGVGQSR